MPAVYVVASRRNGALYTGVSSNLIERVHRHRNATLPGFSARYGCRMFAWFERHESMEAAIAREKQIKAWRREWKLALIEAGNPEWRDLAEDLGFDPLP